MTENIEEAGCPVDIQEAEEKATEDAVAAREEALTKPLREMKHSWRLPRDINPREYKGV
jgi:hypothetical protein